MGLCNVSILNGYLSSKLCIKCFMALAEEATESKGGHFAKLNDFLLQKLQSYGEVSNLRGAMAPLAPLFLPPMLYGIS